MSWAKWGLGSIDREEANRTQFGTQFGAGRAVLCTTEPKAKPIYRAFGVFGFGWIATGVLRVASRPTRLLRRTQASSPTRTEG